MLSGHSAPFRPVQTDVAVTRDRDDLAAHPRWKELEDASGLVGERVRLKVRLFEAGLCALRWESPPWYGDLPIEGI